MADYTTWLVLGRFQDSMRLFDAPRSYYVSNEERLIEFKVRLSFTRRATINPRNPAAPSVTPIRQAFSFFICSQTKAFARINISPSRPDIFISHCALVLPLLSKSCNYFCVYLLIATTGILDRKTPCCHFSSFTFSWRLSHPSWSRSLLPRMVTPSTP